MNEQTSTTTSVENTEAATPTLTTLTSSTCHTDGVNEVVGITHDTQSSHLSPEPAPAPPNVASTYLPSIQPGVTLPGGLDVLFREIPEGCRLQLTITDIPESANMRGYFTVCELLALKVVLIERYKMRMNGSLPMPEFQESKPPEHGPPQPPPPPPQSQSQQPQPKVEAIQVHHREVCHGGLPAPPLPLYRSLEHGPPQPSPPPPQSQSQQPQPIVEAIQVHHREVCHGLPAPPLPLYRSLEHGVAVESYSYAGPNKNLADTWGTHTLIMSHGPPQPPPHSQSQQPQPEVEAIQAHHREVRHGIPPLPLPPYRSLEHGVAVESYSYAGPNKNLAATWGTPTFIMSHGSPQPPPQSQAQQPSPEVEAIQTYPHHREVRHGLPPPPPYRSLGLVMRFLQIGNYSFRSFSEVNPNRCKVLFNTQHILYECHLPIVDSVRDSFQPLRKLLTIDIKFEQISQMQFDTDKLYLRVDGAPNLTITYNPVTAEDNMTPTLTAQDKFLLEQIDNGQLILSPCHQLYFLNERLVQNLKAHFREMPQFSRFFHYENVNMAVLQQTNTFI